MGVKAIWDVLEGAMDERVPFAVFVTRFHEHHNRPLRVAIDGYQWLFEALSPLPYDTPQNARVGKVLQVFHARIRNLISLNVSFVIVFDGCYKPRFKRRSISTKEHDKIKDLNYDLHYSEMMRFLEDCPVNAYDTPDVAALKHMLSLWNIDFVEAPADGEAECALLQKLGIVDYVISNDSDTLSFGATKVLRNFSKYESDSPAGAGARVNSSLKLTNDWWVTPVHMDEVTSQKGFTAERFVMLSILCGADYNEGVTKLGAIRSAQLALCGTSKMIERSATFQYDGLHDYSSELCALYKSNSDNLSAQERRRRYEAFQHSLFQMVKEHATALFGRNEQQLTAGVMNFSGWPPEYVVGLYYKPLVCPQSRQFRFRESTTNNSESANTLSAFTHPQFSEIYGLIRQFPHANISDLAGWYFREMTNAYLLKYITARQGSKWVDDDEFAFQKVRSKSFGAEEDTLAVFVLSLKAMKSGIDYFKVEGLYIDPEAAGTNVSLIVELLPTDLANHLYSLETERAKQMELRRSPKKKGSNNASPVKKSPTKRANLGTNTSPLKKLMQPTITSSKLVSPRKLSSPPKPNALKRSLSFMDAPPPLMKLAAISPKKVKNNSLTRTADSNPFFSTTEASIMSPQAAESGDQEANGQLVPPRPTTPQWTQYDGFEMILSDSSAPISPTTQDDASRVVVGSDQTGLEVLGEGRKSVELRGKNLMVQTPRKKKLPTKVVPITSFYSPSKRTNESIESFLRTKHEETPLIRSPSKKFASPVMQNPRSHIQDSDIARKVKVTPPNREWAIIDLQGEGLSMTTMQSATEPLEPLPKAVGSKSHSLEATASLPSGNIDAYKHQLDHSESVPPPTEKPSTKLSPLSVKLNLGAVIETSAKHPLVSRTPKLDISPHDAFQKFISKDLDGSILDKETREIIRSSQVKFKPSKHSNGRSMLYEHVKRKLNMGEHDERPVRYVGPGPIEEVFVGITDDESGVGLISDDL